MQRIERNARIYEGNVRFSLSLDDIYLYYDNTIKNAENLPIIYQFEKLFFVEIPMV